jgi:hypothetical protein
MFQVFENQSLASVRGGFFLLVLSLESFHAARCVDELLLAGEKGMTLRANFEVDLGFR